MLFAKVELKKAEKAKQELIKNRLINSDFKMFREEGFFFIPVIDKIKGYEFVDRQGELKDEKMNKFSVEICKMLSDDEIKHFNGAYDAVGTIAIIEIDRELEYKEVEIAKMLLKCDKRIRTVVKKVGEHKGEFRLQDYKYLAGVETFETLHKENGVVLKLDIRKTYYSPRSSAERLRISSLIKKRENVLVMFSGVGIYGFVFSKHSPASKIVEIEINPDACRFAFESLKLNKRIKNVELHCSDVRKFFSVNNERFDRVVMPLPKSASDFLDVVKKVVGKKAIVHFYFFDTFDAVKNEIKIMELFLRYFDRINVLKIVKAGQQSPRIYRLCADVEIFN